MMYRGKNRIEDLPNRIFKYYPFDSNLNESRIVGNVYLASPLDFNDPFDCQLKVTNNIKDIDKDEQWIRGKLFEVGIKEKQNDFISKLMENDQQVVEYVRRKQLEKLGVLCLTTSHDNNLIWGYYTNNKGFCIEYDSELIIRKLIIGFINNLSWELTKYLFEEKEYKKKAEARNKNKKRINQSILLFSNEAVLLITNNYLNSCDDKEAILNFIRNVYVKRFGGDPVKYKLDPSQLNVPFLFSGNEQNSIQTKYYTKGKEWQIENEYRLTVSLGGKSIVDLGQDCVKSIRIGCNMSNLQVFEIISIISKHQMNNVKLFKMNKEFSGLIEEELDLYELIRLYDDFLITINRCKKNTEFP